MISECWNTRTDISKFVPPQYAHIHTLNSLSMLMFERTKGRRNGENYVRTPAGFHVPINLKL